MLLASWLLLLLSSFQRFSAVVKVGGCKCRCFYVCVVFVFIAYQVRDGLGASCAATPEGNGGAPSSSAPQQLPMISCSCCYCCSVWFSIVNVDAAAAAIEC